MEKGPSRKEIEDVVDFAADGSSFHRLLRSHFLFPIANILLGNVFIH